MKYKTFLPFILCLIMLALVGCSSINQLRFEGQTQNWRAMMLVSLKGDDYYESEYVLEYIGEVELESMQYEFDYPGGKIKVNEGKLDNTKVFKTKGGGNGAIPPKESNVKVTVNWNGKMEQFYLSA